MPSKRLEAMTKLLDDSTIREGGVEVPALPQVLPFHASLSSSFSYVLASNRILDICLAADATKPNAFDTFLTFENPAFCSLSAIPRYNLPLSLLSGLPVFIAVFVRFDGKYL
jgi:hypothetical protein